MLCPGPLYRGGYNGLASSDQFIEGCRADYASCCEWTTSWTKLNLAIAAGDSTKG